VAALVAIGVLLVFASGALYIWQDAVTRRVTSRSLGSLAPGYAATKLGYRLYVGLVADVGLIALAIGLNIAWLIIAAIVLFIIETIAVAIGEVVTYRKLKS
jgi:hypothetical protein